MSAAQRAAASAQLCEKLQEEIPNGAVVFAYWPLGSEPDIRPALEALNERNCKIGLPRVHDEGMTFHHCTNFETLEFSTMGVGEPAASEPVLGPSEAALVLVPGLAFARNGGARLGRGGGYYDRYLATLASDTRTIGIAYECQIFDAVPTEAHDILLGDVISA